MWESSPSRSRRRATTFSRRSKLAHTEFQVKEIKGETYREPVLESGIG
jgi:hypothetical protein